MAAQILVGPFWRRCCWSWGAVFVFVVVLLLVVVVGVCCVVSYVFLCCVVLLGSNWWEMTPVQQVVEHVSGIR